MNPLDTDLAALLVHRVDSLLSVAPGHTAASNTGAAATQAFASGAGTNAASPPAVSAQTALSAMARTLDAIVRSGGTATPAVLGQTPVWPYPPGATMLAPNWAQQVLTSAASAGHTPATNSANPANPAAVALTAALRQTVAQCGLFYEAHLAQWLVGQRSLQALLDEPQNRLVSSPRGLPPSPLSAALADVFADASAESTSFRASSRWTEGARMATSASAPNAGTNTSTNTSTSTSTSTGTTVTPLAARLAAASQAMAERLSSLSAPATPVRRLYGGEPDTSAMSLANAGDASSSQAAQSGLLPVIHPATASLVRQQLDLLASEQFRWSGEAWPGAKFDWTIERDDSERRGRGHRDSSAAAPAQDEARVWRTRVTLSLPVLGTVDAELALTGAQLVVRLQANADGAERLVQQGEAFGQRLAAAGIQLHGLSIRAVADEASLWQPFHESETNETPEPGATDPAQAASAYARAAATAATRASGHTAQPASQQAAGKADDVDWDVR